jgi:RNA polymerase sigma factor (sigma-70 family)
MPSDRELVSQVLDAYALEGSGRGGDPFVCLTRRHDAFLRATLSGQSWTLRHDLDDLVQEVWVKLWRNDWHGLRQWRGITEGGPNVSLRPYLRTIARNVLMDYLRSRPPERFLEHGEAENLEDDQALPAVDPGDVDRVIQACGRVCPNRNCQIVRLYYLDEATPRDIAERFNLSERGVRTVLYRCRLLIREQLGL